MTLLEVRAQLALLNKKLLAEWTWTDRWACSEAGLLAMEPRGLHREMLTVAWNKGGGLPIDPDAIQRACRVSRDEWDRCWPAVQAFWHEDSGCLVNDDQLEVLALAIAYARGKQDRAKAAADKRWAKQRAAAEGEAAAGAEDEAAAGCSGIAQALPEQCPPSPSHQHAVDVRSLQQSRPSSSSSPRPVTDDDGGRDVAAVLDFYTAVPGTRPKPSRADRETAAALLKQGISLQAIRAGIITAVARRELRKNAPRSRISSLAYFADAIQEAVDSPSEAGYVDYLAGRLSFKRRPHVFLQREAAHVQAEVHRELLAEAAARGGRAVAAGLWTHILADRERALTREAFAQWFLPIVPRTVQQSPRGACLILEPPDQRFADQFAAFYGRVLGELLNGVEVVYQVGRVMERAPPAEAARWDRGQGP